MNKIALSLILLASSLSIAQWRSGSVKLGYYNPIATEGGFIVGFEGGQFMDQNLAWTWGFDWFHKNYVDKQLVAQLNEVYPGTIGTVNELRAKTSIHDFPLMLGVMARFPINRRAEFYANGGIGAEVLLIYYRNFQNPDLNEFEAAFDFNWRIGAGVAFSIGPRSEIFGEVSYHNSTPSWQYEVNDIPGFPPRIFERSYDMSGFMTRVGFRFFY